MFVVAFVLVFGSIFLLLYDSWKDYREEKNQKVKKYAGGNYFGNGSSGSDSSSDSSYYGSSNSITNEPLNYFNYGGSYDSDNSSYNSDSGSSSFDGGSFGGSGAGDDW